MFTEIILILLLHGYIAGEDDNRNITGLQIRKEETPRLSGNSTEFSSVVRHSNRHRKETVRRTYDSKIFRFSASRGEDATNEFKTKGDLLVQPEKHDRSEPHVPMFLISTSNRGNNAVVASNENYNSSDAIEADGTYNLQYYAHRPQHQYSPQYSNWHVNRQQHNDPCASYSSQYHHNIQQAHFGQLSEQNDPYLTQATYNVHYYAQAHQQPQLHPIRFRNYISSDASGRMGYNTQFVNPCIPNQPIPPSFSGGARHLYQYPNPPKHHHQLWPNQPPNLISYEAIPPNLQFHHPSQIYGNVHPPQQLHSFQGYPPQVNPYDYRDPLPNYSPPKSVGGPPPKYITPRPTPPKYITPRPTPPKYITPRHTPPKYITPRPTPPKHTHPTKYTPQIWSPNTKSYTPPTCYGGKCSTRYTPPTKPTPPIYTPSVWSPRTKSHTPTISYTPSTCYGRKCTTKYTPPTKPTPPVWSPNTKSHSPPPCYGRRCSTPSLPNGYGTRPPRTKGYWNNG